MPTPEKQNGPEHSAEQPRSLERAPESPDTKVEVTPESKEEHEKNIEKARTEVAHEAISGREVNHGEHKKNDDNTTRVAYHSRKESYEQTMKNVQSEMSAPARIFSRIIHKPLIERTSEVLGSTVARPDAILSGSIFAFLLVLGLYILARYNGFALSGFETIGAFIIGWILGIVFDLVRATVTGKRS